MIKNINLLELIEWTRKDALKSEIPILNWITRIPDLLIHLKLLPRPFHLKHDTIENNNLPNISPSQVGTLQVLILVKVTKAIGYLYDELTILEWINEWKINKPI